MWGLWGSGEHGLAGNMRSLAPEGCVGAVCVLASSMGVYGTYTDRFFHAGGTSVCVLYINLNF